MSVSLFAQQNEKQKNKIKDSFPEKWSKTYEEISEHILNYTPKIVLYTENEEIYVFTRKAILKCSALTGEIIKKHELDAAVASPVAIKDDKAAFYLEDGTLILSAFKPEYKKVFSVETGEKNVVSVDILNDKLLSVTSTGLITMRAAETGNLLQTVELKQEISFSAEIAEEMETAFIFSQSGSIFKVSLKSGKILARGTLETPPCSPALYFDERLYLGLEGGFFTSLDAENLDEKWTFETVNNSVAKPVELDGNICFGTLSNQVYCRGLNSGNLDFRISAPKRIYLPVKEVDEYIFVFPFEGSFIVAKLEQLKARAEFKYEGRIAAVPLFLSDKYILISIFKDGSMRAYDYRDVKRLQPPAKKPAKRKRRRR